MVDSFQQLENEKLTNVQKFIIEHVGCYEKSIAPLTGAHFGISRQAVHKQIQELIEKGILEAEGKTRARTYSLKMISCYLDTIPLSADTQEDLIWTDDVLPMFKGVQQNVRRICNYGFTEILNNAIDHSDSKTCKIFVRINADEINISITDSGIGIFKKIKDALNLTDEHQAILDLSKGKLTTDKTRHSGEGIFFTSRIFDRFMICSRGISFLAGEDSDWLIDDDPDEEFIDGTWVMMSIKNRSVKELNDVFKKYTSSEDGHPGFTKTHIAIKLALYQNDGLISRSQAKRILSRTEKFKEIILDFSGVPSIGQAFSDEIFRVFKNKNPGIRLIPINMNDDVEIMVQRAQASRSDG